MSKAKTMAKVSTKGVFNIFWGLIVSSVISAIGVMIVAGILTEAEYGLVAIALTGPNLISIFRDWGVDWATIKYTAQYRAENKEHNIRPVLASVVLFEVLLGFSLSIISFFLSGFMASNIFERPDLAPLIQIASFVIFAEALMKAAQAAFTGYEKMEYHSITSVVYSSLKTGFMILLAVLGFGTFGAVVGTTVAYVISGVIGVTLLYTVVYRNIPRQIENGGLQIFLTIKTLFRYGLPLSVSAIVGGFLGQFYNVLLAIYCSDLFIGNYQVAINFGSIVTFFVMPVLTVLLPAFSKIDSQTEQKTLGSVFQFSVKYASLLIVPVAFVVIALAQPSVSTFFGTKYSYSPLYLALYVVTFIYTAFGYLSIENILKSQGRTDVNMKLTLITSGISLVLNLILIPSFGILGLLATNIFAAIPSIFVALWWIKKKFNATIYWGSSTRVVLASALSSLVTYLTVSVLSLPSVLTLIVGAILFLVVYLVLVPMLGAVTVADVQNFKDMIKGLGPLAPLFAVPLLVIERLTVFFQRSQNRIRRSS